MATEAKWSDFTSLDGTRTLAAANKLLPPWVALLLVIAIGWQLATIVWALVPGSATGDPVAVPAGQVITGSQGAPGADVQAIAVAHMFGEASADGEQAVQGRLIQDLACYAGDGGAVLTVTTGQGQALEPGRLVDVQMTNHLNLVAGGLAKTEFARAFVHGLSLPKISGQIHHSSQMGDLSSPIR